MVLENPASHFASLIISGFLPFHPSFSLSALDRFRLTAELFQPSPSLTPFLSFDPFPNMRTTSFFIALIPSLIGLLLLPSSPVEAFNIACCPSNGTNVTLNSFLPPYGSPIVGSEESLLKSENDSYELVLAVWQDSTSVAHCMAAVRNMHIGSRSQVWAANGGQMLEASSCQMRLSEDGDFSLQSGSAIAWHTNTGGRGAQNLYLQESGNLVLQDKTGGILWQSFDQSPAFILLPGMHFTADTTLVSSSSVGLNGGFSVPGNYSMVMDKQGLLLLFTTGSNFVYWSYKMSTNDSDKLVAYASLEDGITFFDNQSTALATIPPNIVPPTNGTARVAYIDYLTSNLVGYFQDPVDHSWVLFYNSSISPCAYASFCGEFSLCDPAHNQCSCPDSFKRNGDQSEGCAPGTGDPTASNGNCSENDHSAYSFIVVNVSFHPQLSPQSSKSRDDCQSLCLANCTCRAALYDSNTSSCSLFSTIQTVSKGDNNGQFLLLKIGKAKSATKKIALGIVGGVVALSICFILFFLLKRGYQAKPETDELFLDALPRLPPRFSYKELQSGTKDFSRKLGAGGFGTVYEGVLPSEDKVAVKKLEGGLGQSSDQFRAEVATIGSVSHVNLVFLKGFCIDGDKRLLVYEYMVNGSLDKWLFSTSAAEQQCSESVILDWDTRCRIALDAAKGLAYLHHECTHRIVHCDIKPENILLDHRFSAKVADFGLSKLMTEQQSFAMTTLKGTRGYLAPEWLQDVTITEKSDVYSYGVVLLELISGRRCLDSTIETEKRYLPKWVMTVARSDGRMAEVLDTRLCGKVEEESVEKMVRIALWCVQQEPGVRPSMVNVVQMIEGLVKVPEPPLQADHESEHYESLRKLSGIELSTAASSSMAGDDDASSMQGASWLLAEVTTR